MQDGWPPPLRRGVQAIVIAGIALLTGCQSYERAPLDLGAHRASLESRLVDTESVEAFAEALSATGAGRARYIRYQRWRVVG